MSDDGARRRAQAFIAHGTLLDGAGRLFRRHISLRVTDEGRASSNGLATRAFTISDGLRVMATRRFRTLAFFYNTIADNGFSRAHISAANARRYTSS